MTTDVNRLKWQEVVQAQDAKRLYVADRDKRLTEGARVEIKSGGYAECRGTVTHRFGARVDVALDGMLGPDLTFTPAQLLLLDETV